MWAGKSITYTFKLYECVHENNPHPQILQRLKEIMSWWDYTGDEYFCVKTQQCATDVIINPEINVLGIIK